MQIAPPVAGRSHRRNSIGIMGAAMDRKPRLLLLGTVAMLTINGASVAQSQDRPAADDQKITLEAITRTCQDIHKNPGAAGEMPTATQYGVEIHCRLVGATGVTRAQVSPSEVCMRQIGSSDWIRSGVGVEIFCRPGKSGSQPANVTGSGRHITPEDVARLCRKQHNNPQATAELPFIGQHGIELKCRLVNASGFTIAQVSPEDVCEEMTGRREWIRLDPQIICRGQFVVAPDPVIGPSPSPRPGPSPGPAPKPDDTAEREREPERGSGSKPKSSNRDTPVNANTLGPGCGKVRFAQRGDMNAPLTGPWFGPVRVSVECNGEITPEEACRRAAGVSEWYLGLGPVLYCRTAPQRTEEAMADVWRACGRKGFKGGAYNPQQGVRCGYAPNVTTLSPPEVCRLLFGTTANRRTESNLIVCEP
jgi:hypothetical protein